MTLALTTLQTCALWSDAPAEVLQEAAARGALRPLRRRALALTLPEMGRMVGAVVSGRVQAIAHTPDERECALASFAVGAHFGDAEAWGPAEVAGMPTVWYVAATDAAVALWPKMALEAIATRWPALWQRLLIAALARERQWQRWRQWWNVPDAVTRVAGVLALLASDSPQGDLPAGITQQEIAGLANTTRETVTRVMQRLQAAGAVVRTPAGWQVDADKLATWQREALKS